LASIEIFKRNDLKLRFSICDQDDVPLDITTARITFVVKTRFGEGRKVLQKSSEEGDVTVTGTHNNICEIDLVKEDTDNLTPKSYLYEILIEFPIGGGEYSRYTGTIDDFEVKDTLIMV